MLGTAVIESLPLRHAVWTAEKAGSSTSEIRENCPYFAIVPGQTGLQRTHCSAAKAVTVPAFLRKAHVQSGFKAGIGECNAIRSRDSAVAS